MAGGIVAAGPRPGAPITIVGAGPAGLASAIVLARAGRSVLVREMRSVVGGRFHGDFQGLENWSDESDVLDELREAGMGIGFDHHPVHDSIAFDAWGEAYPVHSERPFYYLVTRGSEAHSLDTALLDQARAEGVEVRFGDRVDTAERPAILASGPRTADAIAAGYVFHTDLSDGSWVVFCDRQGPLGYAYLLIHGGRGTVASCMFTGFKQQAEHVAAAVDFFRERVGLEMRDPRPFGGYANFRMPRSAVLGGRLVIGEQAGFQDALAGFGMRYALRSGILAARSVIEGLDYESLWRRELAPALRTSISNRFFFNVLGERGWRWALRGLSRTDTSARLRRLYAPSLLTRALYPVARLRYRHALRDPSCDHVGCDCVWCRHGLRASAPLGTPTLRGGEAASRS